MKVLGTCPTTEHTLTPPIISTACTLIEDHAGDHSFGPGVMIRRRPPAAFTGLAGLFTGAACSAAALQAAILIAHSPSWLWWFAWALGMLAGVGAVVVVAGRARTPTPLTDAQLAAELSTLRRKVGNIAAAAERAQEHVLAYPVSVGPEMADLAGVLGTTALGLRGVLALPETGGER